jgi:hypothetical protein
LWAEEILISKPGHPSDGTPTKVKPSTGMIEAGYVPDVRRPAVVDNWKDNDVAKRLLNVDFLEAFNWPEPGPGSGSATITGGNGVGGVAIGPGPDRRLVIVHNLGDALYASYNGGYSWAADVGQVGTINYYDVASSPSSVAALFDDGTDGKVICYGTGDATWTSQTLTTAPTVRRIIYDPYESVYLIGGANASPLPKLWQLADGSGAMPMTEVQINQASPGDTNPIQWIAASPDYKIAASYASGTDTSFFYQWEAGDTAFPAMSSPPVSGAGHSIRALLWLPEDEVFLAAVYHAASTSTRIYTALSTLAGGWTLVETINGEVLSDSMAVLGSLIVGAVEANVTDGSGAAITPRMLCVSGDAGLSWELVSDPVQRHQGSPTPEATKVRAVGNRFIAFGYKAAGEVFTALSIRAGAFPA